MPSQVDFFNASQTPPIDCGILGKVLEALDLRAHARVSDASASAVPTGSRSHGC